MNPIIELVSNIGNNNNLISFLAGLGGTTFTASAIFFFKFWRTSRDRFFLLFSAACALLATERLCAVFIQAPWEPLVSPATEAGSWLYLIRLAAFITILLAIIEKNKRERRF